MTDDLRRWARAGIPYTPPDERLAAKQAAEGPVPDPQEYEYDYFGKKLYYRSGVREERARWRAIRPYVLTKQPIPADDAYSVAPDDPDDYEEGDPTTGGRVEWNRHLQEVDEWSNSMGYPRDYGRWLNRPAWVVRNAAWERYRQQPPPVDAVPCGWCPVLEAQRQDFQPNIRDMVPASLVPSFRCSRPTDTDDFHAQHAPVAVPVKVV